MARKNKNAPSVEVETVEVVAKESVQAKMLAEAKAARAKKGAKPTAKQWLESIKSAKGDRSNAWYIRQGVAAGYSETQMLEAV